MALFIDFGIQIKCPMKHVGHKSAVMVQETEAESYLGYGRLVWFWHSGPFEWITIQVLTYKKINLQQYKKS